MIAHNFIELAVAKSPQPVREWIETRSRRRNMRLFMTLYKDPKSTMQNILNEAAFKMSTQMFMRMLDAEGFSHCFFCPSRQQLRKHPMGMMCPGHFAMSTKPKETTNANSNAGSKED